MYYNPKVKVTLEALVDAIIPNTPRLAFEQGAIQAVGGLYSHIDEYLIWSLDHFYSNLALASPTAELLDIAARQLIEMGAAGKCLDPAACPNGSSFAALSQKDRLKAITLLPFPYQNNPIFNQIIADALDRFTVFGYYSEWSGYGVTRFAPFEERKLEDIPVSWKQVRYPGKAYRYHALRGYLVDKFTE
ncbi:MAG TPA: hypothetical protein VIM51_04595 [Desulfosporosinus sp.]